MQHWNSSYLTSVAIKTTGPDPLIHEIYQIALIPLNSDLTLKREKMPFFIDISIDNIQDIHPSVYRGSKKAAILKAIEHGHDQFTALDLLEKWIARLEMKPTKYGSPRQLIPLAFNYPTIYAFLHRWLTPEVYRIWFHWQFRDVLATSGFFNDLKGAKAEYVKFNKIDFKWICSCVGVSLSSRPSALEIAKAQAESYRKLVYHNADL